MGAQRSELARLNRYILDNLATPFVYGAFDCCLAAARMVEFVSTARLAVPEYSSIEEAKEIMEAAGGMVELARSIAEPAGLVRAVGPKIPTDVVVLSRPFPMLGFVEGTGEWILCPKHRGWARISIKRVSGFVTWRIPVQCHL